MPEKPEVKLFSLSTCSHCKAARTLLEQHHVKASVTEVDRLQGDERSDVLKTVKQYNDRVSFPTLVIGDEVVVGYKADQIRNALRKSGLHNDTKQSND